MSIIELGGLAGGILSVLALITKIISLITTIQSLIQRLDILQSDLQSNKEKQGVMARQISGQERRIHTLELTMESIREDVAETKNSVKELVKHVYGQHSL